MCFDFFHMPVFFNTLTESRPARFTILWLINYACIRFFSCKLAKNLFKMGNVKPTLNKNTATAKIVDFKSLRNYNKTKTSHLFDIY